MLSIVYSHKITDQQINTGMLESCHYDTFFQDAKYFSSGKEVFLTSNSLDLVLQPHSEHILKLVLPLFSEYLPCMYNIHSPKALDHECCELQPSCDICHNRDT